MSDKVYRLKPLIWRDGDDYSSAYDAMFDLYVTCRNGWWDWNLSGHPAANFSIPTREAAKADAEAWRVRQYEEVLEEVK